MTIPSASRRTVLCGAVLAGAAGAGLVGCSAPDNGKNASSAPAEPVTLGPAEDVPVGGAKLYPEQRLLVSRPAKEEYKAFSAVCTHQHCVLAGIEKTEATCGCHGSRFDATTGRVLQGPAVDPLPAVPVKAEGGKLIAG